jgi:hypothetical protein
MRIKRHRTLVAVADFPKGAVGAALTFLVSEETPKAFGDDLGTGQADS